MPPRRKGKAAQLPASVDLGSDRLACEVDDLCFLLDRQTGTLPPVLVRDENATTLRYDRVAEVAEVAEVADEPSEQGERGIRRACVTVTAVDPSLRSKLA